MEHVRTRRHSTRLGHIVCWSLVLVASGASVAAQSTQDRIVIGTDVACRAEPHRDAQVVRGHHLGYRLRRPARVTVDGDAWYRLDHGPCWTYGPLTAAVNTRNPASTLLTVAEHALALEDAADFEHLVAVDNLLIAPWLSDLYLEEVPPLLALRHLQVVDRAADRVRYSLANHVEPLQRAWVLGQSGKVGQASFSRTFYVPADVFWDLYERYADAPEADMIAWAAAQVHIPIDDCEPVCLLSVVAESTMRYWSAFPDGSHIVEAIERSAERIEDASRYCVQISAEGIGPSPDLEFESVRTSLEEYSAQIRRSLDAVTDSAKDALLTHLDDVDYWCATDGVAHLDDPRAIPSLVRFLDSHRRTSINSRFRREFEEAAVQALGDDDPRIVAAGLATLRMVVRSDAGALSNDAATVVRRTAERWLTDSPQTGFTLAAAILLAGLIADPDLLEVVETLATDANAVAARGITDVQAVADLQRLAAEQVADVPAVPRP